MSIQREIKAISDNESFCVKYVKQHYRVSDSDVELYSSFKISVLLTDGLIAVTGDKIVNGECGSVMFFRPDEIHFGRFLRSGVHEYLDFYIPMSYFNNFAGGDILTDFFYDTSANRINCIMPDPDSRQRLLKIARETISALNGAFETDNIRIFSHMLEIVLLCRDCYSRQLTYASDTTPHYISLVIKYINEHFSEKISLRQISAEIGCSVAYISRIFKNYTGVTIYRHITDVRITNAQRILKNGASVTEACFSCGFDSCSNFISTFKRIVGKTPNEYKNNILNL